MNNLRPDEQAKLSEIERNENINRGTKKLATTGLNIGAGLYGAGIATKLAPFLSSHIPTDLAIKGINKISPQLGSVLKKGMGLGLSIQDGLKYVEENLQKKKQEDTEPEKQNILEQYSPELFNFINGEIQKGRSLLETVSMANTLEKFKPIIKKLTEDHKTPFANIVQSIFGTGELGGGDIGTQIVSAFNQSSQKQMNPIEQSRQKGLQKFNQKIKKPSLIQEETDRFEQGYGDGFRKKANMALDNVLGM